MNAQRGLSSTRGRPGMRGPMKFSPNLNLSGRSIVSAEKDTSEEPSSSSSAVKSQQSKGRQFRGRGRRGHFSIATEGVFSVGLSATDNWRQRSEGQLGGSSSSGKSKTADRKSVNIDDQLWHHLQNNEKYASDHQDHSVLPPLVVCDPKGVDTELPLLLENYGKFVKKSLVDVFLADGKEAIENRIVYLRLPTVLPQLLGYSTSKMTLDQPEKDGKRRKHVLDMISSCSLKELKIRRSGKIFISFQTSKGGTLHLPVLVKSNSQQQKICSLDYDMRLPEVAGTMHFMGNLDDIMLCHIDMDNMDHLQFWRDVKLWRDEKLK